MDVVSKTRKILKKEGIHAALRFLNSRTPHRFTGIYRYDEDILRNVFLFDQFNPEITHGQDVQMENAYCANVGLAGKSLQFSDINTDRDVMAKSGSPVISYCGALIKDSSGNPYGTLCHFDLKPCQEPVNDMLILENVAPMVYRTMMEEGQPEHGLLQATNVFH